MNRHFDPRRDEQGVIRRWLPFALLALAIHLGVLQVAAPWLGGPVEPREAPPVEWRSVSSAEWRRNMEVRPRSVQPTPPRIEARRPEVEPRAAEPEPAPPPPEDRPRGQVVDIARPEVEERPADARFLSSYDSRVERETRARRTAPHLNVLPREQRGAVEQPAPLPRAEERPERPEAERPAEEPRELVLRDRPAERAREQTPARRGGAERGERFLVPRVQPQARMELSESERGLFQNRPEQRLGMAGNADRLDIRLRLDPGLLEGMDQGTTDPGASAPAAPGGDGPATRRERRSLMPDMRTLAEIAGGPSNDYLGDVEEADETWLNSRGFRFATFFNRIKREVSLNWHPQRIHQMYDPTFRVHGLQNRRTVVDIVLGADGSVEDVRLREPSGVDFLDQEAVAAIYRAGPFPHPPTGIVEADGKIRFPFGFYFMISDAGVPRLR